MEKIGYARVSSKDQNLGRQIEALKKQNVIKIFQEKISGKNTDRPELKKMLNFIRENDEVVVVSLDRLGRKSEDIKNILQEIKNKKATINVLNLPSLQGIENRNLRELLNGIIIDLYAYTAEQERKEILERQKQGIALAKKRGIYKGKQTKYTINSYAFKNSLDLYRNRSQNKLSVKQIANANGFSRATFYRRLNEYKKISKVEY